MLPIKVDTRGTKINKIQSLFSKGNLELGDGRCEQIIKPLYVKLYSSGINQVV